MAILHPLFLAEVSGGNPDVEDGNGIWAIGRFFGREDTEWIGGRSFRGFGFLEFRQEGTDTLGLEIEIGLGVGGVDVAALGSPRHQGAVGVLDDEVGFGLGFGGLGPEQAFVALDRGIAGGAFRAVGDDLAIPDDQIGADDDADVVELESLAGVDAADLADGVGFQDPEGSVFAEIPLCLEGSAVELDVVA